jgi:hypothetical protein
MPEQQEPSNQVNEEQLLANAIPIDVDATDANDSTDHDSESLTPIDLDEVEATTSNVVGSNKIRTFDTRKPHVDSWKRTPNVTGSGAIHVKTFVTKLRLDAIDHLDEQINEWLDNHPEYEVKFVSQTIGKLVGKNTEDAMFTSVWV